MTADAPAEPAGDLSLTQAAVRLGVTEKTVTRYIRGGKLPARRNPASNRVLIRAADVAALLAGEPIGAAPAPAAG